MVPHKNIFGSSTSVQATQPLHLPVCFFSATNIIFVLSTNPLVSLRWQKWTTNVRCTCSAYTSRKRSGKCGRRG